MPASILIVEDERDLASAVQHALTREGFDAHVVDTGAAALATIRGEAAPELVLLDLTLPDVTGIEVCRALRADPATQELPVVMISARVEESDRVVGFEAGADDYIIKPFSLRELVLRVRAVLRRRETASPGATRVVCGRISVDQAGHQAWVDEQELVLTALEFRLLTTFVTRPGRVLAREDLLAEVWGMAVDVTTRTVDTHILRLREKLGPAADQLQTLRGVGYRFTADAATQ